MYGHAIVCRPAGRVPQCTSPVPHGAPFCNGDNGDVHVCTSLHVHISVAGLCLVGCCSGALWYCELGLLPWADRSMRVGYSR